MISSKEASRLRFSPPVGGCDPRLEKLGIIIPWEIRKVLKVIKIRPIHL